MDDTYTLTLHGTTNTGAEYGLTQDGRIAIIMPAEFTGESEKGNKTRAFASGFRGFSKIKLAGMDVSISAIVVHHNPVAKLTRSIAREEAKLAALKAQAAALAPVANPVDAALTLLANAG